MIKYLPYQPIVFESLFSAGPKLGIDRGNALPVDTLDLTKFQFKSTFEGPNVIFDPGFDGENTTGKIPTYWVGASWTFGTGQSTYDGGGGTLETTDDALIQGKTYKVTINLSGLTSGQINVNANGEATQGEVFFNGETVIYITVAENPNHDDGRLELEPDNLNTGVVINSVTAVQAPDNYYVGIYDTNNTQQAETTDIVLAKDSVTVTTEWNDLGLPSGCYKFGVIDEFNTIINDDPGFNGIGSDYTVNNGQLAEGRLYGDITSTSYQDIYTLTGLQDATTYIVEFNVKRFGAFPDVRIKSGSNAFSVSDNGGFSQEITTDGTQLVIQLRGGTTATNTVAIFSYLTVREKGSVAGTVDKYSNKLDYNDWSSRTLRMNWCNNDDAFDFVYEGSGFTPVLRVEAKLTRPSYPSESERFRKSNGITNVLYFEPKKIYDLIVAPVPELVHDALSIAQGHDSFYIEDEGFAITEQDYEPEWEEATDYEASAVIEVETQPALTPKIRCSSAPKKDCSFPPSFLLLANEQDFLLLTNNDKVLLAEQF